MDYQKQNFQDGEVLTAEKLNHMEDGIKNVTSYFSRPNLLDNWYFADPVNQRVQTEYTGGEYSIDRWMINNATVTVAANGIKIASAIYDNNFLQKIEPSLWSFLVGKNLTFSVLVKSIDGTWVSASGNNQIWGSITTVGVHSFTAILTESATETHSFFSFGGEAGKHIAIEAIKLELGDTQTLAHQDADGRWVLNDPPPNKQQELAKCQRYFQTFATQSLCPTDALDFRPVMRVNPALSTLTIGDKTLYTATADL